MANFGLSYLGNVQMAEESAAAAYATAITANAGLHVTVPILSESFQVQEGFVLTGGINGSPYRKVSQPGRRIVQGGIQLEPDGSAIGLLFKWANRCASSDVASTFFPAPVLVSTVASATAGVVPASAYLYKICNVYKQTSSGRCYLSNPSNEVGLTPADALHKVDVTYTDGTPPTGYTLVGAFLFRTAAAGSTGTEKLTTNSVVGAAAVIHDNDLDVALTATQVIPAAITQHLFTGGTATLGTGTFPQQKSFTTECNVNTGGTITSLQYKGCKVNTLSMTIPGNGPVTMSMEMHAQDVAQINATVPVFTLIRPFMGFDCTVYLQLKNTTDTVEAKLEHFQFSLSNNLNPRYSLNGSRTCRALRELRRKVNGSFSISLEDMNQYTNVVNDNDMSIRVNGVGPSIDQLTANPFNQTLNANIVRAQPFQFEVDLPAISYTTAQANLNGENQIMQNVPFEAWFPDIGSKAYDMQLSVWNTAATYTDVT